MSTKEILLKELEEVPEDRLQEVIDFVLFLKFRRKEDELENTLLSEPSLAKDWMKPEEDVAWSDL